MRMGTGRMPNPLLRARYPLLPAGHRLLPAVTRLAAYALDTCVSWYS